MHLNLVLNVIFTSTSFLMLSMALILYQRWRTEHYRIFTITQAAGFMLTLGSILFSSLKDGGDGALLLIAAHTFYLTGLFYFFNAKRFNRIYIVLSVAGLQIALLLVSIFMKDIMFQYTVPISGLFLDLYFYFFLIQEHPKKLNFLVTISPQATALIFLTIYIAVGSPIILSITLILFVLFYLAVFYIFFDRIVELMQNVSISNVLDGLTGLYTKKYFISKVRECMNSGLSSTVIFIDIDNFKMLNDTQGHATGDEVLKFCGNVLKEVCGEIGLAGRYGGEEMVALITDPRAQPQVVTERIRDRIEKESTAIFPVTVSVGYKVFSDDVLTAEEFIRQADLAMYAAKTTGKNRVVKYEDRDNLKIQEDENHIVQQPESEMSEEVTEDMFPDNNTMEDQQEIVVSNIVKESCDIPSDEVDNTSTNDASILAEPESKFPRKRKNPFSKV